MNQDNKVFIVLSAFNGFLFLGLLLAMMAGCDDSPPPEPKHEVRVGNEVIPAFELEDIRKVDLRDFKLATLPDGHDYWIYRHSGGEKGFAAMAHTPECKKCQNAISR